MRFKMQFLFVLAVLLCANVAIAATLRVPSQYPTIQAAINAASNGDTVLVADGTYTGAGNKNLTWDGNEKHITVKSENGAENCIIDCENDGRGFCFEITNQNTNDVIDGFTIRNGLIVEADGGGIYCYYSSPTITNCIITGNSAESDPITGCSRGGGISCEYSSAIITNCTISENSAKDEGGGISSNDSSLTIINCTITGNTVSYFGGGVSFYYVSSPTIIDCTISGNGGHYGGGIICFNSSPVITNCIITENIASFGGGIFIDAQASPTITNCTISGNTSGAGICLVDDSSSIVINSILWNDTKEINLQSFNSPLFPSLTISYSNVEGGQAGAHVEEGCTLNWGTGNINSNPLFINADNDNYHLSSNSPCIDEGTNQDAPETDIDGQRRPFNGTVDMGSDEYVWACSLDTGNGEVNLSLDKGAFSELEAVDEDDLSEAGKPDLTFPLGFFSFRIIDLAPGETVTITLTLPENVPTDAEYWKYGKISGNPTNHWYQIPFGSNNGDNVITLTITDGGNGDNDLLANGVIVDPSGLGLKGEEPPTPYCGDGTCNGTETCSSCPEDCGSCGDGGNGSDGGGGGSGGGGGCFIATAAFGTPMAGDVKALSLFRDRYLCTTNSGRTFVKVYNKLSPPIARFIKDKVIIKKSVRIFLKPLVLIAKSTE